MPDCVFLEPARTIVTVLPAKRFAGYSCLIFEVTLLAAVGPLQNLGLACGNAHRTSTFEPTRRSVTPPRPASFRVFPHVCS